MPPSKQSLFKFEKWPNREEENGAKFGRWWPKPKSFLLVSCSSFSIYFNLIVRWNRNGPPKVAFIKWHEWSNVICQLPWNWTKRKLWPTTMIALQLDASKCKTASIMNHLLWKNTSVFSILNVCKKFLPIFFIFT